MHRLIARILLTLVLVGTIAPLAMAISAPAPHACCMRKPMVQHGDQFSAALNCCNHDCCRVVVTSQWASVTAAAASDFSSPLSNLPPISAEQGGISGYGALHSGRSPPTFSLA
jgi:hypothetical protein